MIRQLSYNSQARACSAGCQYCFAKTKQYKSLCNPRSECDFLKSSSPLKVLYPSCDNEFTRNVHYFDQIVQQPGEGFKVYSFSTKLEVPESVLEHIAELNKLLANESTGMIKLSVSLSSKSLLDIIEPGTISYEQRIETLERIVQLGVPTSLNIKPQLPFVSSGEYCSILDDVFGLGIPTLIGGLYVNTEGEFYKHYIYGKYPQVLRPVSWLPGQPEWPYVEDELQTQMILRHARDRKQLIFQSDLDVINCLIGTCENGSSNLAGNDHSVINSSFQHAMKVSCESGKSLV